MLPWTKRGVGALGLVCLLFAGCQMADVFSLSAVGVSTPGGDRVIAGSLETVSQSTQNSLSQLGLTAVVTKQGEAIHIASKTPAGAKFKLVLTREKTPEGEKTPVRIEWEGGR